MKRLLPRYRTLEGKRVSFTDLCKTGIFMSVSFTPHVADLAALLIHYERMALRYQDNPELCETMKSHYNRIHDVWRCLHQYDRKCDRIPWWHKNHVA